MHVETSPQSMEAKAHHKVVFCQDEEFIHLLWLSSQNSSMERKKKKNYFNNNSKKIILNLKHIPS